MSTDILALCLLQTVFHQLVKQISHVWCGNHGQTLPDKNSNNQYFLKISVNTHLTVDEGSLIYEEKLSKASTVFGTFFGKKHFAHGTIINVE